MTTKTRLTQADLDSQGQLLEHLSPDDIIRWTVDTFEGRIAVLSAFQKAGCVLCHRIMSLGLADRIDVIFVDTGVNFPETLETVDKHRRLYGLNVVALHPERTMEQQTREEGVLYLSKEGQERCCALRKREPLRQIRGKYEALLSSLHRASGGARKDVPVLAVDTDLELVRVHPMVRMTEAEIEGYIHENNVVVNPLHAQGYPTVSCTRCTTPVLPGEDERAGRWRHLENVASYCRINPTDRGGTDNTDFVELSWETAQKFLHFDI